ncbi:hypothetical protein M1146_03340 [Patescibacteria group bacterium]|nr:hypothetical protein [Patescibacteria group bacterium]
MTATFYRTVEAEFIQQINVDFELSTGSGQNARSTIELAEDLFNEPFDLNSDKFFLEVAQLETKLEKHAQEPAVKSNNAGISDYFGQHV